MELWWRTAAVQALQACIQGPLAAAPRARIPPRRLRQPPPIGCLTGA